MALNLGSNQITPIQKHNVINNLPNKTIIPNQNQQVITPTSEPINVIIPGTSGRTFSSSPIEVNIDTSFLIYGETYQVIADRILYKTNYRSSTCSSISINAQWIAGEDEEIPFTLTGIGSNDSQPIKVTLSKTKIRIYVQSVLGGDMGLNGQNNTITFTYLGNYDGIDQVTVQPIPSDYIIPEGTLSILNSGTHNVASYANIDVLSRSGSNQFSIVFDTFTARVDKYVTIPVGYKSTSQILSSSYQLSFSNGFTVIPSEISQIYPLSMTWLTGSVIVESIPNSILVYEKIANKTITTSEANEFFTSQTNINVMAFYSCSSLSGVLNLGSVSIIGSSTFYNCSKITQIIGPNVSVISSNAFNYCYSLTSVSFPNLTSVGYRPFSYCSNLSSVYFPELINGPMSGWGSVQYFDLPKVSYLSGYYFYQCYRMISFNLPLVTKISGYRVFYGCSSLNSIYLSNVSQLSGSQIFASCSQLQLISLPKLNNITSSNVFINCSRLISIYFMNSEMVTLTYSNIFSGTNIPIVNSTLTGAFGSIYVPNSLLNTYKTNSLWSWYSDRFVGV